MNTMRILRLFVSNYRIFSLMIFFSASLFNPAQAKADVNALSSALANFRNHIAGVTALNTAQITEQTVVIQDNLESVGQNETIIKEAFDLVALYESVEGPLYLNERTESWISPQDQTGIELDWAIFHVMQGIIDHVYTAEHIKRYPHILDGAKFETAKYFPGDVDPPSDANTRYQVNINCSMPEIWWGEPVMFSDEFARRPTGAYVAPGSIVTINVPPAIVNKGFVIRVGAHSWDHANRPMYRRLNRVSVTYPITGTTIQVANPLGGGIYIEVPYKAEYGVLPIEITNAVRSPFFSARSFDKTTLEEWQNVERHHPGPWADFESDIFMMQIPGNWVYNFDDPVSLMVEWDRSMKAVTELFGRPSVLNITTLYIQLDVMMRGGAFFPGYPQANYVYNPREIVNGYKDHFTLKGPEHASHISFHELGHAMLFTKFSGEVEAVVNLPYVAVMNKEFGMPLDEAFGTSFGNPNISLDQAAKMWMVTENFRNGNPMDITNSTKNEVRYQQRGYGKYVEIARIFGWDALSSFWASVQQDFLNGIVYPRNSDPTDNRILRMSKAAGADLTPLIHFWGVHPDEPQELKASMAQAGINPSAEIYDMLQHYRTIIPMNNRDFLNHANTIFPNGINQGNPDYGVGYYHAWAPKYNDTHGQSAVKAMDDIIKMYFPNGRPTTN